MSHLLDASNRPLAARLWQASTPTQSLVRQIVLALAGTAVLWVSAKVQIPFWPVPATMQTFVVMMIGALYGSRLGAATILAYLAEGAAGLPVFTDTPQRGIGILYMMGPTGGYLAGFIAAAFVIGFLVERGYGRSILKAGLVIFAGNVALYALGLAWLAHLIGPEKAVEFGLMPFVLADLVKIALAAALTMALAPRKA